MSTSLIPSSSGDCFFQIGGIIPHNKFVWLSGMDYAVVLKLKKKEKILLVSTTPSASRTNPE